MPEEGAVLDKQLAETLGARAGDTVRVDGVPLKIAAISDQSVGRTQSVSSTQAEALGKPALRSVICRVQEADEGKLMEFLIRREAYIYSVFTRMAYASYYAIFITYDVPASLVAGFAVLIGLVIVVNTGNTNLLEQKRQLSVLRALGFQQSQISRSWYVQSLLYFLFSLALGLPGGIVVAKKHAYSHFSITMHAFRCELQGDVKTPNCDRPWHWITESQLKDYAFPKANHKIFSAMKLG